MNPHPYDLTHRPQTPWPAELEGPTLAKTRATRALANSLEALFTNTNGLFYPAVRDELVNRIKQEPLNTPLISSSPLPEFIIGALFGCGQRSPYTPTLRDLFFVLALDHQIGRRAAVPALMPLVERAAGMTAEEREKSVFVIAALALANRPERFRGLTPDEQHRITPGLIAGGDGPYVATDVARLRHSGWRGPGGIDVDELMLVTSVELVEMDRDGKRLARESLSGLDRILQLTEKPAIAEMIRRVGARPLSIIDRLEQGLLLPEELEHDIRACIADVAADGDCTLAGDVLIELLRENPDDNDGAEHLVHEAERALSLNRANKIAAQVASSDAHQEAATAPPARDEEHLLFPTL